MAAASAACQAWLLNRRDAAAGAGTGGNVSDCARARARKRRKVSGSGSGLGPSSADSERALVVPGPPGPPPAVGVTVAIASELGTASGLYDALKPGVFCPTQGHISSCSQSGVDGGKQDNSEPSLASQQLQVVQGKAKSDTDTNLRPRKNQGRALGVNVLHCLEWGCERSFRSATELRQHMLCAHSSAS